MRYRMVIVLSAMLAVIACAGEPATQGEAGEAASGEYVAGEVLVQFEPGTSSKRIADIARIVGAQERERLGAPAIWLLRFPQEIAVEDMVRRLRAFDEVRSAEPNRVIRLPPEAR